MTPAITSRILTPVRCQHCQGDVTLFTVGNGPDHVAACGNRVCSNATEIMLQAVGFRGVGNVRNRLLKEGGRR